MVRQCLCGFEMDDFYCFFFLFCHLRKGLLCCFFAHSVQIRFGEAQVWNVDCVRSPIRRSQSCVKERKILPGKLFDDARHELTNRKGKLYCKLFASSMEAHIAL